MQKLTDDFLKNVNPQSGKRLEYRDDKEPGLIFRVTEQGVRSWSVRYRNTAGEHRRKSLGIFPAVGLSKARQEAKKVKGAVAGGSDVVASERAAKAEERRKRLHTITGLAEAYFVAAEEGTHRGGPRAKPKRPGTISEEKRVFNKLVGPAFGDMPVANVTRSDIRDFVAKQSRKAKSTGRHCRNIIRQLLSFAAREGIVEFNPATDIPVAMSLPRKRVVADDELNAIWLACRQPQDIEGLALTKLMGVALRMAAATLQRGGEVVGMRWSEIDRASRTWLIPAERMKGKVAHLVPLSDLAIELLNEAAALGLDNGSDYVFPSPRADDDQPMDRRAFTRAMNRIVVALGIPSATPHDLRRTGATTITSERIGLPRFIVSQVLAHAGDTGGAAAVTGIHYDLNDYLREKRTALDAWGHLLSTIVKA